MKPKYLISLVVSAILTLMPLPVLAAPVTYLIEGQFGRIVRQTQAGASIVFNASMSIQFTVTDPTELFDSLSNPNIGEFAVSSAFVTIPAFGLSEVPITNTNLTVFQADLNSLEQFGLVFTLTPTAISRTFADVLATEVGLDFIANPNEPAPLRFDLTGIDLTIAGVPALLLADGSVVTFGVDLNLGVVPGATISNVFTTPFVFAGTPGIPNCHGKSVSALTQQFGSVSAAASALGFSSVRALQDVIREFCKK